jgi:hypothetical protein
LKTSLLNTQKPAEFRTLTTSDLSSAPSGGRNGGVLTGGSPGWGGGVGRAGAAVAAVAAAIHDTTRRNTCSPYRLPLSSEGPITEFKISAFELGLTFSQQFDI